MNSVPGYFGGVGFGNLENTYAGRNEFVHFQLITTLIIFFGTKMNLRTVLPSSHF